MGPSVSDAARAGVRPNLLLHCWVLALTAQRARTLMLATAGSSPAVLQPEVSRSCHHPTSHHHQPRSQRHQHLLSNIAQYILHYISQNMQPLQILVRKNSIFPLPSDNPTPNIISDSAIPNKSKTFKISVFFALCWNFGQI